MRGIRWKALPVLALGALALAGPSLAGEPPPEAAVVAVEPLAATRDRFDKDVVSIRGEGRLFEQAFAQEFGAPLRSLLGRVGSLAQERPGVAKCPTAAQTTAGRLGPVADSKDVVLLDRYLRIFTSHLLALSATKLASGEAGMALIRAHLEGTGLEGLDAATLVAAAARDEEFTTDQLARWEEERRLASLAGREELFEGVSDGFILERAEFTGSTLGRWFHELQLTPVRAGAVLRNILHRGDRSRSLLGPAEKEAMTSLDFEEARRFEAAFEREFGAPLQALIQQNRER